MSRKISQFTGLSVIPSDSYLTLVSGSQNYKISIGDFLSAIGVTGDISQLGDDGVSILNQPTANVNQIRNLLASKGIAASITASGGIEINADFGVGSAGFPILIDADTSPVIRNLQAGENVSIVESGSELIINAGDEFTPTNTVVINSVADLPTPVSGVIPLEDDTVYLFSASVNIGLFALYLGAGTTIAGSGTFAITISADTTASPAVIISDKNVRNSVESISFDCPGRQLFDISSNVAGEGLFSCSNVFVEACNSIGNFEDLGGVGFNDCVFNLVNGQGFRFIGDIDVVNIDSVFIQDINSAPAQLDTLARVNAFSFENSTVVFPTAPNQVIGGATLSQNINAGGFGTVRANTIIGGSTIGNVKPSDTRWEFSNNSGLENSNNSFNAALVNNATATTITGVGVLTRVAGTWTELNSSRFSFNALGLFSYTGQTDINLHFSANFSVTRAGSGSGNVIVFYLFKEGVQVADVESRIDIATGDTNTISLNAIIPMTFGDTLEIRVANTTAANDVTVIDAQVTGISI